MDTKSGGVALRPRPGTPRARPWTSARATSCSGDNYMAVTAALAVAHGAVDRRGQSTGTSPRRPLTSRTAMGPDTHR